VQLAEEIAALEREIQPLQERLAKLKHRLGVINGAAASALRRRESLADRNRQIWAEPRRSGQGTGTCPTVDKGNWLSSTACQENSSPGFSKS
jgi:hypothetical protein